MWYIIKDLSMFKWVPKGIPISTYHNVMKWKPVSENTYKKLCNIAWRILSAHIQEKKWKWFSINIFITDLDMELRWHKQFKWTNPETIMNQAAAYLHDPDSLYDIWKDSLFNNPEINKSENTNSKIAENETE